MSDTHDQPAEPNEQESEGDERRDLAGEDPELALLPRGGGDDPPSWSPRDELADSMSLVQRVQADQDRKALEELMRRYLPRLERKVRIIMSSKLRQRYDIEDIVQAAMVKGIGQLDQFEFREPASLIHWLTQIALNEIRSKSRQRAASEFAEDLYGEHGLQLECEREPGPPEKVQIDEARALCDAAVGRLPEHYQAVILARDYDGGSWEHVSEVLGRSSEACQMIRKRAKEKLLDYLRGLDI